MAVPTIFFQVGHELKDSDKRGVQNKGKKRCLTAEIDNDHPLG